MSSWKEDVAQKFGDAAPLYGRYSTIQSDAAEQLLRHCPALDKADILEIGCGTGALTRHLVQKYPCARFHITDLSYEMLAHARALDELSCVDIAWDVMDAERPVLERQYDLIIGNMVFQWFEDKEAALDRLSGFLKPGGMILFTMPGPESFREWRYVLSRLEYPSGLLDFTPPVQAVIIGEEEKTVWYDNGLAFLKSFKKGGARTSRAGYEPIGLKALKEACTLFDQEFQGKITWQILYGLYQKAPVVAEKSRRNILLF